MNYRCVDEGVMAKILATEGTSVVPVNQLIALILETYMNSHTKKVQVHDTNVLSNVCNLMFSNFNSNNTITFLYSLRV